ncbi:MAG: hypothetical protein QM791_03725 [Ferruginibacter sp.]
MYNLIASSFLQKKHCHLPGIGDLTLVTHPAETDFVNTAIKAPREEFTFTPVANGRIVFNEFSAISELMKRKLEEDGTVELTGIGIFSKEPSDDTIRFSPLKLDPVFYPPVTAERVIRQDAEHAILVGDKETTNTAMSDFYSEKEKVKDRWWIWALVLGGIAIGAIAYYLSQYGVNSFGNIIKP